MLYRNLYKSTYKCCDGPTVFSERELGAPPSGFKKPRITLGRVGTRTLQASNTEAASARPRAVASPSGSPRRMATSSP